jgi:hypothetical protein
LQQTPSTQKPLAHWVAAVQAWPSARFGTQLEAEQKKLLKQLESFVQLVGQLGLEPLQT